MASIQKRINKNGTFHWRLLIRLKGYPIVCNHFDRKKEAEDWGQAVERQIKAVKYKFDRANLYKKRNPSKLLVFASETAFGKIDIKKAWQVAAKKARLNDVDFHDLRHIYSTEASKQGASTIQLLTAMGHRTLFRWPLGSQACKMLAPWIN